MATSLSIKGKTSGGDGVTTTINYVNPNATNGQLQSLASAFNDLTTNTVSDVTRIDKNSLTNTVAKLPRNLQLKQGDAVITTVSNATLSTTMQGGTEVLIVFDGTDITAADFSIKMTADTPAHEPPFTNWYSWDDDGTTIHNMYLARYTQVDCVGTVITISLPETDTYEAATATLTITE